MGRYLLAAPASAVLVLRSRWLFPLQQAPRRLASTDLPRLRLPGQHEQAACCPSCLPHIVNSPCLRLSPSISSISHVIIQNDITLDCPDSHRRPISHLLSTSTAISFLSCACLALPTASGYSQHASTRTSTLCLTKTLSFSFSTHASFRPVLPHPTSRLPSRFPLNHLVAPPSLTHPLFTVRCSAPIF